MSDQIITCPHCQKQIPLSEALRHEIEDQILTSERQKHQLEIQKLSKSLEDKLKKELEEKTALEVKDLEKQLAEKDSKVKQMQEYELELRKQKRELEEKTKELNLEVERRVDEERKKVAETVSKQILEESRLKELEKDKIISDLKASLEDARRKASQGSQQTQGEVLELDLENTLRNAFLSDDISPVEKGIKGADISQTIRSPKGFPCGVILWEFKNTKAWSDDWVSKLKDDIRATKANIGVVVSTVLPKSATTAMTLYDGVWVTSPDLIIPLAMLLRQCFLDTAYQKAISLNRGKKADLLYEYVTGHEFKQQVEALAEVCSEMREQLAKERTAFERIWKAREAQIYRLINSTAGVYGSMQGLVGSSLPQIPGLDLDTPDAQSKLLN